VPGLFGAIEQARGDDQVTVDYDPDFGYPTLIRRDPDAGTTDDELTVTVTNFSTLES
jgi:hypothetical protein